MRERRWDKTMATSTESPRTTEKKYTDIELLTRWAQDDRAAGDALLRRHYGAIERFFASKVPEQAVGDLVQETFQICAQVYRRFDPERSRFRTFLFGIAFKVFMKHLGRIRPVDLVDMDQMTAASVAPSSVTRLLAHERSRILLEALRTIPLYDQVILELYYWEKLTAKQIGEIVGRPEGTIRTHLRCAKQALVAAHSEAERRAAELRPTSSDLDHWAASVHAVGTATR